MKTHLIVVFFVVILVYLFCPRIGHTGREKQEIELPPPTLFGKAVRVQNSVINNSPTCRFLLLCLQPPASESESSQNKWERQFKGPHMWVIVSEKTEVMNKSGRAGEVFAGQTIRAWCSGSMALTDPPQWVADKVVLGRSQ